MHPGIPLMSVYALSRASTLPRVLPCPVTQMTPIVQCSELFINELEVPPHTISAKSFVFFVDFYEIDHRHRTAFIEISGMDWAHFCVNLNRQN